MDDIKTPDGQYEYSDGCGMMSARLCTQLSTQLKLDCEPSALQIRYGGCKGVIALDVRSHNRLSIKEQWYKYQFVIYVRFLC